jgi:4'-phosphopantetheinyl transferase
LRKNTNPKVRTARYRSWHLIDLSQMNAPLASPISVTSSKFFLSPLSSPSRSPHKPKPIHLSFIHQEDLSLNHEYMSRELTHAEIEKVTKYRLLKDQKLALGSIILQHHAICHMFGCDKSQYEIARTAHGKPFLMSKYFNVRAWNYNVSHDGEYVGIVESHDGNIGLDIATLLPRKTWNGSSVEYINLFTEQFTSHEMIWQQSALTEKERYRRFFVNWSLKEAFIKAIGKGLQMNLLNIEFIIHVNDLENGSFDGNASLLVFGEEASEMVYGAQEWDFRFCSLDEHHVAAIAKGPSPSLHQDHFGSLSSSSRSVVLLPKRVTMDSLIQSSPIYF